MLPHDPSVRRIGLFAGLQQFCETLSFFASALYAFERTGSTVAVSAVMMLVVLAEGCGSLLGGALADRVDRQRLALVSAVASALLLLTLCAAPSLVLLSAVMMASRLCASPIRPALAGALPNLAVRSDLQKANGYIDALRCSAGVAAPLIGGVGVVVVGAGGLFVLAACALLGASLILASVRGEFHAPHPPATAPAPGGLAAGISVLRRDQLLAALVGAAAVAVLASAAGMVADLPYATLDLGLGSAAYGALAATAGVGRTLGSVLAPLVTRRIGAPVTFGGGLLLQGTGAAFAALAPVPGAAFAAFLVGGLGAGTAGVSDAIIVQQRAPDAVRARVRATNDAIIKAATLGSLAMGGPLVALLGARGVYAVAAAGLLLAGLAAAVAFASPARTRRVVTRSTARLRFA